MNTAMIRFKIERSSKSKVLFVTKRLKPSSNLFEGKIFNHVQLNPIFYPFSTISLIDNESSDDSSSHALSTSSTFSSDPNSTFNIYSKSYNKRLSKSHKDIQLHLHPFSKVFNAKSIKKANIDKYILRKFRAFIIDSYLKRPHVFFNTNRSFWDAFTHHKLYPPMKFNDCIGYNRYVVFKSFNTQYYHWLFSKKGACNLFESFIHEKGDSLLNALTKSYALEKDADKDVIEKIGEYLNQIACIYSYSNRPPVKKCNEPLCICNGCNMSIDDLLKDEDSEKCEQQVNPLDIKHPYFEAVNYLSSVHEGDDHQGKDEDSWAYMADRERWLNEKCQSNDSKECSVACNQRDLSQSCQEMCYSYCSYQENKAYECKEEAYLGDNNDCCCSERSKEGYCEDKDYDFNLFGKTTKTDTKRKKK